MKNRLLSILFLMALLALTGCQAPDEEAAVETPAVTEDVQKEETTVEPVDEEASNETEKKRLEGPFKDMIAPDFTLADADGNEITLSSLRGNAVALIFWTSW